MLVNELQPMTLDTPNLFSQIEASFWQIDVLKKMAIIGEYAPQTKNSSLGHFLSNNTEYG